MTYLQTTMLSVLMIMTSSVAVYAKDVDDEWRRLSQESANLQRIGEYSQSTDINKKLLEIADQKGYDSQEVINVLKDLSTSYLAQGYVEQAQTYSTRRLKLAQQSLDKYPNHIENLTFVAANQNKMNPETEVYYKRALKIIEDEKGKNSIESVELLIGLMAVYQRRYDFKQADVCLRDLLKIIDGQSKENPSLAFKSLMMIDGDNFLYSDDESEKYIKSIQAELRKKAEEIYFEIRNPDLTEIQDFAQILVLQGQLEEAVKMYQKIIGAVEKDQTRNIFERLSVFDGFGSVLKKQEKYDDAIVQYEKKAKLIEEKFGKNHPMLISVLLDLAECYHKRGKIDFSKKLLDRSSEIAEQGLLSGNVYALMAQSRILQLSLSQGGSSQVENVNEKMFDMLKSFAGTESAPNGFSILTLPQETDETQP